MNALLYVISEIHNTIPFDILNVAFNIDEVPETINLSSLDEKIMRKVVKKRVMMDANLVGGIQTTIPIANLNPAHFEDNYTIYLIPDELTMGKEIISVLGLTTMPLNYGPGNPSMANALGAPINVNNPYSVNFNPIMQIADRIGNSAAPYGTLYNAHTELVARNTVLVYAHYRQMSSFGIRVNLENDSNMNNLSPRSYKNFAMLAILAVKAYIYNKLLIAINSGYLSGGQELGVFKAIVEEYASANEDYNTYLREVWMSVAFMNDSARMSRFVNSLIAPDL